MLVYAVFLLVCAGPLLVYDGHALAKNEHK